MLLALQLNSLLGEPPDLVEVPDVVGQTQADGTLALEGAGFVVVVATAYSSTVPVGEIISQLPVGGAEAVEGSAVTITVSLGEAPVYSEDTRVTVPYLIGYTQEPAQAVIASIYCTAVLSGSGGTVTAQSEPAFSLVERGTSITITMGGTIHKVRTRTRQSGLPRYS
jgi:beta-lactam-binding protein with PASTA domain